MPLDAGVEPCAFEVGNPFTKTAAFEAFELADVTGDGIADAIVGALDGRIRVLAADGQGRFLADDGGFEGGSHRFLTTADFNGDGELDVTTGTMTEVVGVLLGSGGGRFGPPIFSATPGLSNQTTGAAGDFNGDGKQDVLNVHVHVTFGSPLKTVSRAVLLLGKGNGSFEPPRSFEVGDLVSAVVVGDFDGDLRLDAVFTDETASAVVLYTGYGNGTFVLKSRVTLPFQPISAASGDVNSDGARDVVVGFPGGFALLLGRCDGTLTLDRTWNTPRSTVTTDKSLPRDLLIEDVTGEGDPDIIVAYQEVSSAIAVVHSLHDGGFSDSLVYRTPSAARVEVGDVTGDAVVDIVAGSPNDGLTVLRGLGGGAFQTVQSFGAGPRIGAFRIELADFNGDALEDVAAISNALLGSPALQPAAITLLLRTDAGTLSPSSTVTLPGDPLRLAVADLNGDTQVDVAVSYSTKDGGVAVAPGLGNGLLGPIGPIVGEGAKFWSLVSSDLTRDGRTDLIGGYESSAGFSSAGLALLAQTDGGLIWSESLDAGRYVRGLAVADFDKDTLLDVAACAADDQTAGISVSYGVPNGGFTPPQHHATPFVCSGVAAADFDGDTNDDIVATYFPGSLLFGNGNRTFRDGGMTFPTGDITEQLSADIDGDGRVDLLTAERSRLTVRRAVGGGFASPVEFSSATGINSFRVVDFNGDGRLDVITAGGEIGVMLQTACGQ